MTKPTREELFDFWNQLRKERVEKRLLPYEPAPLDFAEAVLEKWGNFDDEDEEISNVEEFSDPCPECGTELEDAPGGGVKCPNKDCDYWFCY